jgi:hypothetical protein
VVSFTRMVTRFSLLFGSLNLPNRT